MGRWSTRVRGLPEAFGELPVACLAEEILEPGEGQVRALVTVAGNPLVSTPNSGRLREAFESLDLMVSIDCYLNETSSRGRRRPPGALAARALALRPRLLPAVRPQHRQLQPAGPAADPRGSSRSGGRCCASPGSSPGPGPDADVDAIDDMVALEVARRETVTEGSPAEGMEPAEVLAGARRAARPGADPRPDAALRPLRRRDRRDRPGRGNGTALSLGRLEGTPHGDRPRPAGAAASRRCCGPRAARSSSARRRSSPTSTASPRRSVAIASSMVLIGRRDLRSNNSWMHNLPHLVRGKDRCTMHVSPADAERLGLSDGGVAAVELARRQRRRPGRGDRRDHGAASSRSPTAGATTPTGRGWRSPRDNAGVNSNLLADETLSTRSPATPSSTASRSRSRPPDDAGDPRSGSLSRRRG